MRQMKFRVHTEYKRRMCFSFLVLLLPFRIFLAPTTSTHIPLSQFSTVVIATYDKGTGIFFL